MYDGAIRSYMPGALRRKAIGRFNLGTARDCGTSDLDEIMPELEEPAPA